MYYQIYYKQLITDVSFVDIGKIVDHHCL